MERRSTGVGQILIAVFKYELSIFTEKYGWMGQFWKLYPSFFYFSDRNTVKGGSNENELWLYSNIKINIKNGSSFNICL